MFTKKICVAGAVICYAVLIGLFVFYQQKPNRNCARGQACIRFCCKNEATCNETFIREHFEIGRSFDDFQVLLGEPKCFTKPGEKIVKKNFQYDGSVDVDSLWYNTEEYCLEDLVDESTVTFRVNVCISIEQIRRVLNITLMSICALLIIATFFLFVFLKDLRADVSGKSEFSFVIALLIMLVPLPFVLLYDLPNLRSLSSFVVIIGFFLSFLWMSVLCFDIWWTVRSTHETSDGAKRFRFYCIYTLGCAGSATFLVFFGYTISPHFFIAAYLFLFLSVVIFIADIVFLILSAINLFKKSRSTNMSDHKWFQDQKRRFWIYLQLFVLLLSSTLVLSHNWSLFQMPFANIVGDAVICFGVLLVFIIFVTRKETHEAFANRNGIARQSLT